MPLPVPEAQADAAVAASDGDSGARGAIGASSSSGGGAAGAGAEAAAATAQQQPAPPRRQELAWVCSCCERECWPIRAESRCLCGHRLKDHGAADARPCGNARCACPRFFFVPAEGSWMPRCRCKHKAAEHDPATLACAKCKGGACARFDSPWVCNCDHPWAQHRQAAVEREVVTLAQRIAGKGAVEAFGADAAAAAAASAVAAAAAEEIGSWAVVRRGEHA